MNDSGSTDSSTNQQSKSSGQYSDKDDDSSSSAVQEENKDVSSGINKSSEDVLLAQPRKEQSGDGSESKSSKWIPLNKREKLSFIHIIGIACASLAGNVLFAILFTLFVPLSEKLKISQIGRTFILFCGSLSGFVVQPLVGIISDTVTFKYGRRRIFMIIGGLLTVIGLLILMYSIEIGQAFNPKNPLPAQQGVMIFGIIYTCITGNMMQSPARILCSDVVPASQNVLMSNIVTVYYGLGGIISNLFGGLAVYKYTSLTQESFILVVGLVIVAVSITVTVIVTPEEPLREKPQSVNPFKNIWSCFRKMPSAMTRSAIVFYFQQVAYYQIGFQLTDTCGREIFGGNNSIDSPQSEIDKYQEGVSWAMACNVLNYAVQFVFSFINPYLSKYISMKIIFGATLLLSGVAYMLFFFVRNKIGIMVMCIPVGLVQVAAFSIPYAVVTMLFPTSELGGNIGLLNCFSTLGQQTSNFLIGMGAAAIWPGKPSHLIGISCIFGYIGTIASFFLIIPDEQKSIESDNLSEVDVKTNDEDEVNGNDNIERSMTDV